VVSVDRGASRDRPAAERRRVDPTGKEALFTAPVAAARDQVATGRSAVGRDALFSAARRRPGTVLVDCESCGERSRVSLVDLGIRLLTVSAWLPARPYAHWMRCPGCEHRTWCRIDWTG
jgi:hypothetical protein